MNVWNFTGNIGRDAEQRFVGSGDSVVSFSVAVSSGWGDKKTTTWVKCSMWGKRGESVLPYLNKGQQVAVSGEATLREYDKKDGSGKGHSMELRVNDVTLVGAKPEGKAPAPASDDSGGFREASTAGATASTGPDYDGGGDELPF